MRIRGTIILLAAAFLVTGNPPVAAKSAPRNLPSSTGALLDVKFSDLWSTSPQARNSVKAELHRRAETGGLSQADAAALVQGLAAVPPDASADAVAAGVAALELLCETPTPALVPQVESAYRHLRPALRPGALTLLACIGTPDAARVALRLTPWSLYNAPGAGELAATDLSGFATSREAATVLFPGLLDHATSGPLQFPVLELLYHCQVEESILPKDLDSHTTTMLEIADRVLTRLASAQRPDPGYWMYARSYHPDRELGAALLDVLAGFGGTATRQLLERACHLADPRLRFFAAQSLEALGVPPDAATVGALAAWPETRSATYDWLLHTDNAELMPDIQATQKALAESDLVAVLCDQGELAEPPAKMELGSIIPWEDPGTSEPQVMYVFRFRPRHPPPGARSGWLAGMAGPFPRSGDPEPFGDLTGTLYEPWVRRTPLGHAQEIARQSAD